MAADAGQLDTHIEIVTPENIAFRYRVAGPFRRLAAYLLDLSIRVSVCIAGMFVLAAMTALGWGSIGLGGWLILMFLLDWFYGGLFEAMMNGQTPGKRLTRLRVLTVDGQPINAMQAVMRNVLRGADAMPPIPWGIPLPLYTLGLLVASSNRRYQRLGDLVCGTMVVIEERPWLLGVARINDQEVIRLAGYLPANFQVSRSMARTLSTYVERRRSFTPSRRADIARHLGEPLRELFHLPQGTNHDLLLCALYYQTFIADSQQDAAHGPPPQQPPDKPPVALGAAAESPSLEINTDPWKSRNP